MQTVGNWGPATIPQGMEKYAQACKACRKLREILSSFFHEFCGRERPVELHHGEQQLHVSLLAINCKACKNSGWTIDGTLSAFLERVRDFLDGAAPHVPPVQADEEPLEVTSEDEMPDGRFGDTL